MADTDSDPDVIALVRGPIKVDRLLEGVSANEAGAIACFQGVVRNSPGHGVPAEDRGRRVKALQYEAYEDMALLHLRQLVEEVRARHDLTRLAIHHRVGRLAVGETSLVVVVSAPHRQAALAACGELLERLKAETPIWKKEIYVDGSSAWIANCMAAS